MTSNNYTNTLLVNLEKEIAGLLIEKLEHRDITLERASLIAKFVLNTLPKGLSNEQVRQIIPSLDDEFFELSNIVYQHMAKYEEKYKSLVLNEIKELISHKHFEQANNLMQKYFDKKYQ